MNNTTDHDFWLSTGGSSLEEEREAEREEQEEEESAESGDDFPDWRYIEEEGEEF